MNCNLRFRRVKSWLVLGMCSLKRGPDPLASVSQQLWLEWGMLSLNTLISLMKYLEVGAGRTCSRGFRLAEYIRLFSVADSLANGSSWECVSYKGQWARPPILYLLPRNALSRVRSLLVRRPLPEAVTSLWTRTMNHNKPIFPQMHLVYGIVVLATENDPPLPRAVSCCNFSTSVLV